MWKFQISGWLTLLFAQAGANGSLYKSSPSLASAFVCNSDVCWGCRGRGNGLQNKLIVSIGQKRKLFSLLQRKGKVSSEYIKNHCQQHPLCMHTPNYPTNHKLFWCTHWSIFKVFRRLHVLVLIVLAFQVYKNIGACITKYIRKTGDLKRNPDDHCQLDFWG